MCKPFVAFVKGLQINFSYFMNCGDTFPILIIPSLYVLSLIYSTSPLHWHFHSMWAPCHFILLCLWCRSTSKELLLPLRVCPLSSSPYQQWRLWTCLLKSPILQILRQITIVCLWLLQNFLHSKFYACLGNLFFLKWLSLSSEIYTPCP